MNHGLPGATKPSWPNRPASGRQDGTGNSFRSPTSGALPVTGTARGGGSCPASDSWILGGQERPAAQGPAARDWHCRRNQHQLRPLRAGISESSPTGPPHPPGNVPELAPATLSSRTFLIKSNLCVDSSGPDQQCRPYGHRNAGPPQVMDVPGPVESAEVADGRIDDAPVDRATLNSAVWYAYWPHVDKSSVLF